MYFSLAICACSTFLQGMYPANMDALTTVPRTPNSRLIKSYLKTILANPESRKIFYFLMLNLCYMLVQMLYGVWTNSLGLISDGTSFSSLQSPTANWQIYIAIHMAFDCMAIGVGLFASVMATWDPNERFTYGYLLKIVAEYTFVDSFYYQIWTHWDIIWIC